MKCFSINGKSLSRQEIMKGVTPKGPIETRQCTDAVCCMAFLMFIGLWIMLSVMAFSWGDPKKLIASTDSLGRVCGAKTKFYDMTSKPFLFFFDLTACFDYSTVFMGCPTPQVCISKCPDTYMLIDYVEHPALTFTMIKSKLICTSDLILDQISNMVDLQKHVDLENCASYYLDSLPTAGICLPRIVSDGWNSLTNTTWKNDTQKNNTIQSLNDDKAYRFFDLLFQARGVIMKIFADLQLAWWQILVCLIIAMLLAFIWIVLMRIFATIMVWVSVVFVGFILLFLTAFSWYKYDQLSIIYQQEHYQFKLMMTSTFRRPKTWLYFAVIFSIISIVFVMFVCFMYDRIRLAIALITEASKAVISMTSALIFPVFPFILHLIVFTFWASISVYLASSGAPLCHYMNVPTDYKNYSNGHLVSNGTECYCGTLLTDHPEKYCQFVEYEQPNSLVAAHMFNLFVFFWAMAFISGFEEIVLAGAFASYYWAFRKPADLPYFPVLGSILRTLRYHLGSVAFGSLVLAFVKFIQSILDYIEKKMKTMQNPLAECVLRSLKWVFWFLEKFVRFLNKNAYILVAVYGNNFCYSAREAFILVTKNILRVVVLNKLTSFLLFLGKLVVVFLSSLIAYGFFSGRFEFSKRLLAHLHYPHFPVIVVGLGAFFICRSFFDVYQMAVDTTFLCFLEDCERNDGSPQKPYFMSKKLRKILHKENKEVPAAGQTEEAVAYF